MFLKVLGSIIVLLSSSFLGYIMSRDCSKRPQQLRSLQNLLQMFENQISYSSDVLAEAFERISRAGGETGIFFRTTVDLLKNGSAANASEAWEKAVKKCIGRTALKREDEQILLSFGKSLGSTDLEGQIKNIRLALGQLALQVEKAEENRKKNESMYKSLGILGGLALVIILI
ncbi:MAG TPA: stage III sporulation protein SpoIIIAB [Clostridiales bacterium]|nr:stage III sporulation protein SpoIIIAB [Clostridiales bacterium]HOL90869.1 stage III sporulation protein SpoIIIAB [Clostridiales bacterium]HPP35203.1 stage III sporulation protein SpoIIIAB [Clostridiales bacterium]